MPDKMGMETSPPSKKFWLGRLFFCVEPLNVEQQITRRPLHSFVVIERLSSNRKKGLRSAEYTGTHDLGFFRMARQQKKTTENSRLTVICRL
jgi:hypothetical protein